MNKLSIMEKEFNFSWNRKIFEVDKPKKEIIFKGCLLNDEIGTYSVKMSFEEEEDFNNFLVGLI